jgi:hypothetical protein
MHQGNVYSKTKYILTINKKIKLIYKTCGDNFENKIKSLISNKFNIE